MCDPSQTSRRPADAVRRRTAAQRSHQPEAARHRLGADAAEDQQAKGGKDRYVPISPRLLEELRDVLEDRSPEQLSVPWQDRRRATVQRHDSESLQDGGGPARINKPVTPHTLRHSFATGLLEAGVDLMAISKLLGHSSFVTTMIYLHCRQQHLGSTPSPIDWLPTRQCPRWVDPSLQNPSPRPTPDPAEETDLA